MTFTQTNGKCSFAGKCQNLCTVYETIRKYCDKLYLRYAQNNVKTRVGQHISDVKHLLKYRIAYDTFACHLAEWRCCERVVASFHIILELY